MSTLGKMSKKFQAARDVMEKNPEVARAIPRWYQMRSSTLYIAMAGVGFRWDVERGLWTRSKKKELAPSRNGTEIKTRTAARRDKVLMRIITHKAVKDLVISEITELIEALNYRVEGVSGGYENADGDYVRVYINMRRISAPGNQNGDEGGS